MISYGLIQDNSTMSFPQLEHRQLHLECVSAPENSEVTPSEHVIIPRTRVVGFCFQSLVPHHCVSSRLSLFTTLHEWLTLRGESLRPTRINTMLRYLRAQDPLPTTDRRPGSHQPGILLGHRLGGVQVQAPLRSTG